MGLVRNHILSCTRSCLDDHEFMPILFHLVRSSFHFCQFLMEKATVCLFVGNMPYCWMIMSDVLFWRGEIPAFCYMGTICTLSHRDHGWYLTVKAAPSLGPLTKWVRTSKQAGGLLKWQTKRSRWSVAVNLRANPAKNSKSRTAPNYR